MSNDSLLLKNKQRQHVQQKDFFMFSFMNADSYLGIIHFLRFKPSGLINKNNNIDSSSQ